VALGVAGAACKNGGGAGTPLAQYFGDVKAAVDAENDDFAELEEPAIDEDDVLDEDEKADVVDYFDAQIGILRTFSDTLTGVAPPPEAQAAHQEVLAALTAELALWEGLRPKLEAVGTPDELAAFTSDEFNGDEANAVFERVSNACLGVQAIADDNNVDVDLTCGAGE
jgi:hypothetical protein